MNPAEYEIMARVEERHWWYRGLRDGIAKSLARPDLQPPEKPHVLDAGCGTGENLRLLRELLDPSYLGGFDHSAEAVAYATMRAVDADVYVSDICDPEIHVDQLDLLISLDVIYIPGVERSLNGVRRLVDRLRPGGLLVLNLPAHNWLYSEHDVAIHTSQRFTAREVRSLLVELGLRVEVLTYRVFFLFPALVLARLPTLLARRPAGTSARSDLHRSHGPWMNRILFGVLQVENSFMARGWRFPWGSSVFAVGRKI